jgi:acid-sensing ion channel, other
LAILSIIYISLELSEKFSNSPLSTVVESTIFPVAEIAYPAVTICNKNRFHKARCEEAEQIFIPKADKETLEIFRLLLASLNSFEFGALDEFHEEVFNFTSPQLASLNLTEVFEYVMLTCEEIFVGRCWWRNKYFDCCDEFFYLQKSEYALCFSFNGAVSPLGRAKEANTSIHYPLRTSSYGDWSGLRVDMSSRTDLAIDEENDGVTVIVQHPNQWPNAGIFVPSGTQTSIVIKPTFSYTTEDVKRLTPEQRQCLNVSSIESQLTTK